MPAASGFRWPAEWERHEATWLSWPHNPDTWPGCLPEAEREYAEIVRALAAGISDSGVDFHPHPTNDAW
ncbi:MAG TPA: agmatine deiminase family protein, partial [Myxococcota bacterium]|nr:agmatine deiminase family protein [Myxococcota bacterium]